jgi:serine/threonine-protein kinase
LRDQQGLVRYIDFDILNLDDEEGSVFVPVIIMQKYDSSLIRDSINSESFLSIFDFLLNTLEKIHNQGIIHRDLKPENILVKNSEYVLADFGVASYNPNIFKIRAKTTRKERVGNRLFSAPEQEVGGIKAHPTMDIYSFGQILQWYCLGETHRGTFRRKITEVFPELDAYDNVIERCLAQDPKLRFQKIEEIREFLLPIRRKDVWYYLYTFHEIIAQSFPKNNFGFSHTNDLKKIDRLFENIKNSESEFGNELWWHDGSRNTYFKLRQKSSGLWMFDNKEIKIKEIWINYDSSVYNSFILIHYLKGEPFIVDGKKQFYTVIVDDKFTISYNEYENGYAEINDEIVKLSEHKVELIERSNTEDYFFIGTRMSSILLPENDVTVRKFIEIIKNSKGKVSEDQLEKFEREIRKHKNYDVMISL